MRGAGIAHINVDLIYGLPRQTAASVAATVRQVTDLAADRIACYGYAHLSERKRNQRLIDTVTLPNVFERFLQAQAIAKAFTDAGYEPIGIDHFAKPADALAVAAREGRLNRNFQGYTDDTSTNLIGFGASAISCLAEGFAQTCPNVEAYAFALGRGQLPVVRGHRLTDDDRARGAIIRQLMCAFQVDLAAHPQHGSFSDELALHRPMAADGLVTQTGTVIALTPLGRLFVRVVATVFDTFRQESSQKFSIAV